MASEFEDALKRNREFLLERAAWFDRQIARITKQGMRSFDTSVTPMREDTEEYLKELMAERAAIGLMLSLARSTDN